MSVSRRLTFAAVLMLGGAVAHAEDYSAGKSPAQLFASDCTACHRSPKGLAKGMDTRSLSGFLREHYTTSPDHASALAGYLAGLGARTSPSAGKRSGTRPGDDESDSKPVRKRRAAPGGGAEHSEAAPARKPQTALTQPASDETPPRPPGTIIRPESDAAALDAESPKRTRRTHAKGENRNSHWRRAPAQPDEAAAAGKGPESKSTSDDAKLQGYAVSGEQAKPAAHDGGTEYTSAVPRTEAPAAATQATAEPAPSAPQSAAESQAPAEDRSAN